MPVKGKEDVVEFEIAVDDPLCMEILECQQHLACVILRLTQGELLLLDVKHEIAARDIFHDEVHPRLGLEA